MAPDSFATLRRLIGSIRKQPEGIDHAEEINCDCTGGVGSRVRVPAALERGHRGSGASVCSTAKVQLRAAPAALLCPPAGGRRLLPDLWVLPAAVPRLRLSPRLRPPLLSAQSSLALTRTAGGVAVSGRRKPAALQVGCKEATKSEHRR